MKKANKSFLKCLGIGALACFGMLTMTGCSFIQITEQEYNRIMDNIEIIEDSVDISDATRYYNNAIMKSMNTAGTFWNNMKVETVVSYFEEDVEILEISETYFLKTELDQQIYFNKKLAPTPSFTNNSYDVMCATEEGIVAMVKDQNGYQKTNHNGYLIDMCLNKDIFINDFYFGRKVEGEFEFFNTSDVLKAELNENYNYVVALLFKEYESDLGNIKFTTYEIENEINQNSELVSQTITITTIQHGITTTRKILNLFTYGTVSFADIEIEYEALLDYGTPPTE